MSIPNVLGTADPLETSVDFVKGCKYTLKVISSNFATLFHQTNRHRASAAFEYCRPGMLSLQSPQVSARNDLGIGPSADIEGFHALSKPSRPVISTGARASDDLSLTLEWTVEDVGDYTSDGQILTEYVIQGSKNANIPSDFSPATGEVEKSDLATTETSWVWQNLEKVCTEAGFYYMRIKASNPFGDSEWSEVRAEGPRAEASLLAMA